MEPNQLPPNPDSQETADNHLLEGLVAATNLFNPAQIWQREVELDKLDEQAAGTIATDTAEPPVV